MTWLGYVHLKIQNFKKDLEKYNPISITIRLKVIKFCFKTKYQRDKRFPLKKNSKHRHICFPQWRQISRQFTNDATTT